MAVPSPYRLLQELVKSGSMAFGTVRGSDSEVLMSHNSRASICGLRVANPFWRLARQHWQRPERTNHPGVISLALLGREGEAALRLFGYGTRWSFGSAHKGCEENASRTPP